MTVSASTASAPTIGAPRPCGLISRRSGESVNATSAAVISRPLWNFTPRRIFSSHFVGSNRVQESARPGTSAAPVPSGFESQSRLMTLS